MSRREKVLYKGLGGGGRLRGREGHREGGVNCGTPKHECLRLQRSYFYYFYLPRISTICMLVEWVFDGVTFDAVKIGRAPYYSLSIHHLVYHIL